ncbi:Detected protein of confused Function [Hibiscus syriacus]|uniref:Protein TIFY n=1 Tax=Hibiscus syriacus TaxID=106335 RepID=A0A6A2ZS11_HIBSY|nr:Detected protein of confused Function [Hibiscus syriacus]
MCCEGGDKDKTTLSPRSRCETNELGGQMTIFYCGKINVYGVPLAKARAIMHLADSPIDFTRDNLRNGNAALRSLLGHLQAAGDKNDVASTTMSSNSHTMQTEKMIEYQQPYMEKGNISSDSDIDGLMNRKVSLQRYLEKRKDRKNLEKGIRQRKGKGREGDGVMASPR